TDKRRVYIDLEESMTISTNTQYGGNTLGLKKLSMRLAIHLSNKEGWLCEHMFVMGIMGPKGRKSYFTGAYPSACGKTSTSMLADEKIVGDDIAYLKIKKKNIFAVNVEQGMFGIIDGVNAKDDPLLWEVLHKPNDIIFSNSLITEENTPFWTESGEEVPERGVNFQGEWTRGKKDAGGKEIPTSHKNARFALDLSILPNVDENLHNPEGVEVKGIIYGGRDSDTSVPVEEAFSWEHGIITKGASLESETTAATLGAVGQRVFNPMSNLDFVSIHIAKYIENNLNIGKNISDPPRIFSVNYFIKNKDGQFLNEKTDKSVWIKWMELRAHNEAEAITTPTGYIPKYEDLKRLFSEVLKKEYSKEDYVKQFTLRIPENLSKIERITDIYKNKIEGTPEILFSTLEDQKKRLIEYKEKHGEYVSPFDLEE
ncbi:MAG: phosphoenolpyruvate carboxykinase (GTP), partial [Spirochaetes bacterium]|nr:phosphoenolpyruvate carboxykinase (GTP) [Spirochaetota bacterium]